MDQTANIVKSMKTIYQGSSLTTMIPGSLIYGRDFSGTIYPFARLDVKLGNTQYQTSQTYAQDYHVDISVWATNLVGTAGNIQTAVYNTFNSSMTLTLDSGCRLLQTTLDTSSLDEDDERNKEQFVMIAKHRLILTIQQVRP